ncbi:MAG: hypothetical protein GYA23_06075 [Methanomicrobiales archaeon]|nr:hypothetical protein [Methanomicrobiales archaeon]
MKPIAGILIFALITAAMIIPGAAMQGPGNAPGDSGPAGDNRGQGQNIHNISVDEATRTVTGQDVIREEEQTESRPGPGSGVQAENRTQTRAEIHVVTVPPGQNVSLMHANIRHDREQLNATLHNQTPVRAGWSKNANDVRLAVHTLLAMENVTGGVGPQVSAIARDFNNSAQHTWELEVQMQNRDIISRLLFGGDQVSAAELATVTAQNQNRIRQIEQLMNTQDLNPETKAILEEQIQIMQQENTRLGQVASAEQQDRGLLGRIGK